MVKLDRYVISCNTLNDLSNKVHVPNKTDNLNLSVSNIFTGINEPKTLTKYISCECKCKFDGKKWNSDQCWNKDQYRCQCKKHIWNPSTSSSKNGKYLASIMDDSAITCDEIIDADAEAKSNDEETKTISKNIICETKAFHILLAFLLITIALLIAVSI